MNSIDEINKSEFRQTPITLPMSRAELTVLGLLNDSPDFILVTGDAYIDHPSFGMALIGKLLWASGYSIAIIAQPDCGNAESFKIFGKPKLGFLVTSGNVDSMVNHYTVAKKKRSKDLYSPGGKAGLRPDRTLTVYSRKIRDIFGMDIPIILGGLEASLRRLSHYDYWSDSVRKSVLIDASADILVYGMGERTILNIAGLLRSGVKIADIRHIDGTVYKTIDINITSDYISLPDYELASREKREYAKSFRIQYENADYLTAKPLIEKCGRLYIVQNPPSRPLSTNEMDAVYSLDFTRQAHPSYKEPIPAIQEVQISITSNRGCFGACNFCALTFHQGRSVSSRSKRSILDEASKLTQLAAFKGYIHDVGGPTANFYKPSCVNQEKNGVCSGKKCLFPKPCPNLTVSHTDYLDILRELRKIPNVKKVFIRSGIRYDYLLYDKSETFFKELCEHHISGQLKVAPEHISPSVLKKMGKPDRSVYDRFVKRYKEINDKLGKNQYLVPYLMSGHPGSGLKEAVELAEYLRDNRISPEQVQDFYPTPGTVSTCMFHTGIDPLTGENVYCTRSPKEKAMQRALIQYKLPQNYSLVHEALILSGRSDLIGFSKNCLIRPKTEPKSNSNNPRTDNKKPIKKKTIRNVHKKKQ